MVEQIGPKKLWEQLRAEAPQYAKLLPALPRLLHDYLAHRPPTQSPELLALLAEQRRTHRLLQAVVYVALGFGAGVALMLWWSRWGAW